jgi:hypothetical protein
VACEKYNLGPMYLSLNTNSWNFYITVAEGAGGREMCYWRPRIVLIGYNNASSRVGDKCIIITIIIITITTTTTTRSRVSSGSIVYDYGLDDRAIGV